MCLKTFFFVQMLFFVLKEYENQWMALLALSVTASYHPISIFPVPYSNPVKKLYSPFSFTGRCNHGDRFYPRVTSRNSVSDFWEVALKEETHLVLPFPPSCWLNTSEICGVLATFLDQEVRQQGWQKSKVVGTLVSHTKELLEQLQIAYGLFFFLM